MKNYIVLFFLVLSTVSFCQQPVFQSFEVDSAAVPRGGMSYLNTFIPVNLRKPVLAEAAGVGGRIIISAVVEPDGHVTGVKITKSLRPDCDREALRVFSGFNAWKPAQKDGEAVRQLVNIPVLFTANTPYTYGDGARVNFYDEDMKPVFSSGQAAYYKQVIPVDTLGLPTGDIIISQRKGQEWKEVSRLVYTFKMDDRPGPLGQRTHWIGYVGATGQRQGSMFAVDADDNITRRAYYENGRLVGTELTYHANGLVAERREEQEKQYVMTSWYPNGQIRQIGVADKNKMATGMDTDKVIAFWDSTGQQLVKDGTGHAMYSNIVRSYANESQTTRNTEQGSYENGLKQGIWTGRYADGSYFYKEHYDKGTCKSGKSLEAGKDTLHYTVREQLPTFKGGLPALGRFLSQNLQYPTRAVQARVQGKVVVSFVINTDGSVQDINVINGLGFGCDEEARRVVNLTNGKWIPGIQYGRPVKVKFNMPINFSM